MWRIDENHARFFAVARGHHADTDHSARNDLSVPAAGHLWRAPDDAPPTRLPRSKGDRGAPRDQPRAHEPALRSGRFRQSRRDRAVFGSLKTAGFESIVCLEHTSSDVADLYLEDHAKAFPFEYSADEMPDLARCIESHQPDPENEVGRWARQFVPPCGSIGTFELLTRLTEGIHRGFRYQRREVKGIQQPVDTLRIGHGSCRDFAMLMIEAARSLGLAARFASGYLAVPLDNPEEPMRGSARGSTHAWAQIYLPGTGWIDFDPTSGRVGKSGLVTVAVVRNPHHATPLHGTFIGFPSDHLGMEVQVSITSGTPEAICATTQRSSRIRSTRLIDTGWNASKVR